MEDQCKHDELGFGKDKSITKNLEDDEKILISCQIFKFNRKNKV